MGNVQYGLPLLSPITPYPKLMQRPYNSIVPTLIADWGDPTFYADMDLIYEKVDADIVNTVKFANNMQNCGLNAPPSTISIFGQQYFPYA